ncbi:MAG: Fe-S cluster assembly protein SufD [Actinomycetota bacterium]|nr:Fe-S cluster assembly protein SufD [Actinomycetota bacterium]
MSLFTADALSDLPGPPWLRARRDAALERFRAADPPTEAQEVWRYSRIDELDLDAYSPLTPGTGDGPVDGSGLESVLPPALEAVAAAVGERAGLVVVHNGRVVRTEVQPALAERGLVLGTLDSDPAGGEDLVGSVAAGPDFFVDLNTALMADVVTVRVPRGVAIERPVLVLHWVDASSGAVFPRLVVKAADASQVSVVDHVASPPGLAAFVAPVVELDAGEAANVAYVGMQELGRKVWQVGYQASRVGRDATLNSVLVALGGEYARVAADSRLEGLGGTSRLRALYFGDGDQMHDFRTLQDHDAPKTTSDLLFKGAVEDRSRAVYSGLIRIRNGAAGTNAFQTNRNLVLGEGAHADSVPNLEIEENDVKCSHASAVGPIDEEQRYYLEARGLPPEAADRLIVLGFFEEILEDINVTGLRSPLRQAVATKLEKATLETAALRTPEAETAEEEPAPLGTGTA